MFTSTGVAFGGTIYADWSLGAGTYTGGNTGNPVDSVGGHNFSNGYGNGGAPTGPSIGGPSTSSSVFTGGGGFYGVAAGTTTFPTNNFSISVYAQPSSTAGGYLFSTNGGASNEIQVGLSGGDWVAYYDTSGSNGGPTNIFASTPATVGTDYFLQVTDSNNSLTFAVNGVVIGSPFAVSTVSINTVHLSVTPGAGTPYYAGYASDLVISSVPEPASIALLGMGICCGALGLRSRRKRSPRTR